jgi:hypothetical protein
LVIKITVKELLMKFMKLVLMVLVFGGMAQGLFAQEKSAYIRPTFGFGFAIADSTGLAAASADVDFVHSLGLTIGLQGLIAWNGDMAVNPAVVGIGYTYDAGKWSVGGKLLGGAILLTGAVGFDINGTWWWKENLGFTGIVNLFFPEDFTIFSVRVGVSLKY